MEIYVNQRIGENEIAVQIFLYPPPDDTPSLTPPNYRDK